MIYKCTAIENERLLEKRPPVYYVLSKFSRGGRHYRFYQESDQYGIVLPTAMRHKDFFAYSRKEYEKLVEEIERGNNSVRNLQDGKKQTSKPEQDEEVREFRAEDLEKLVSTHEDYQGEEGFIVRIYLGDYKKGRIVRVSYMGYIDEPPIVKEDPFMTESNGNAGNKHAPTKTKSRKYQV